MKIELSLAREYVPSWTISDAVRELYQNALDQETQNPLNTMFWNYDATTETLRVGNQHSTLSTNTLLLGATSKADDENTIGQFGEGYKIATLVLVRNGKRVTFYNYGAREVWKPRFVKSRRLNADVLTFFIDKEAVWKSVPDNDLMIEINGITEQEWNEQIVPSNLRLCDHKVLHSTPFGDIINLPGAVFVNGLFVCNYKRYQYGYNFKPAQLKLDRDRKLASDWDLQWLSSKMWVGIPEAIELVQKGYADAANINSMNHINNTSLMDMSNEACRRFFEEYGDNAVPITYQYEADNVPAGYKAVIVPETYKAAIRSSSGYVEPQQQEDDEPTPVEKLRAWYKAYGDLIEDDNILNELRHIIEKLEAYA